MKIAYEQGARCPSRAKTLMLGVAAGTRPGHKTSFRRTLVGAIAIATLAGCAHSLVFNEARDKQGQEAKRASTELKMVDTVRALEKGYAEVAKLELESARSLAETLRNKELGRVGRARALREQADLFPAGDAPDPFNGLVNVLEDRMKELGAKARAKDAASSADAKSTRNCGALDCGSLRTIQAMSRLVQARRESFETARAEFRFLLGYDFRTCAEVETAGARKEKDRLVLKDAFARKLAGAAQRSGVAVAGYYTELGSKCASIDKARAAFKAAIENVGPGSIQAVLEQAERAEKDLAARRSKLVEAEDRLANAVKTFKDEEEKLAPNKESRLRNLEQRADTLRKVIESVGKGADAVGDAGSHAVARELISQLETVLGAITGQESAAGKLDANDRAAVAFVRALPELADEADKLLKEAGRARLVPFAIAREHYRLGVKGFEDELAIKARVVEALRARSDAMTQELAALARVHYLLTEGKPTWERQSLAQLSSAQDAKDRQRLYEALAIYWDEVFLHRSEEQVWKARAGALRYEEGLARSTAAALQWDNLIGGVGTVLADYHAAGVKSAEIAEFLKAFGVIYVGTRIGR